MKKFISYNQSMEILDQIKFSFNKTEKLFISDTLGRVLATDIIAKNNSPEYETSSMDGYAFNYEDIDKGALKIIDKNPAGTVVETKVVSGTCIKTFTGSLMPKGSDTLIPIENVTVENDTIIINEKVPQNFAVRTIGENYKQNEVLIEAGTVIDFAQIGVMASLNMVQIEVYQKPTIAIASTGTEILDIGEEQTNASQIRSSNHLTLEAIAKKYGANVAQMGIVKDDKESIINLLQNALSSSDIVVTTGGVSVGDYDFVKDVIKEELGATLLFQGVYIKPGRHLLIARKDDKFIIGLPGFAYSSTVTFLLYVLPILFKIKNSGEALQIVDAIIDCDFSKKGDLTSFSACNICFRDGEYHIDFDGKKMGSSAILTNMLGDVGLLVQGEDDSNLQKGDSVQIILL
jgi:molybdopterin molybdotransferase